MTAHLSEAEARILGLDRGGAGRRSAGPRPAPPKRTRRTVPAKECSPTFCCVCDEVFTRPVDEDRHFDATHHPRYGCVLEAV